MGLPLASAPESLCILRLSALGDVCHAVPVVRTIQEHWPETRIAWIIGKAEATLVGDLPGIEFVVFDKSRGWRAYRDLRQRMYGRRFDVLLHMQVALRASLASRMVPARIRLGFDRPRARDLQWLFTTHRIKPRRNEHVMDSFFGFAEALGVPGRVLRWDIPIPEPARAFAARHVPGGARALIISPCATPRYRNWRNWLPEGYAAVADYAVEKHGMKVLLTGGRTDAERTYGARILRLAHHKPENLIGRTNLKELLALLARSFVLVAPDSGPIHMATAVGTPVIGLFVTTNPLRAGPYLSQQWVVNRYPEAVEHELGKSVDQVPWGTRVRNPRAVERIRVEDVFEKLDALVKASERAGGDPTHDARM